MWLVIDPDGTCWDYCKGRDRPGTKFKRVPTVYHVDAWWKFVKLIPLLQIDDTIILDEEGMLIKYEKT